MIYLPPFTPSLLSILPLLLLNQATALDLIGHRGGFCAEDSFIPEHSPASYGLGARAGVKFLEPDVVTTKDHVLFVMHGNDLNGTSDVASKFPSRAAIKLISGVNQTGYFCEDFTWDEVSTLRLKARGYGGEGPLDGIYPFFQFHEMLAYTAELARLTNRWGDLGVYPEVKMSTYFRSIGLPIEAKYLEAARDAGYCVDDDAGVCKQVQWGDETEQVPGPFYVQSFYKDSLVYMQTWSDFKLVYLITGTAKGPPRVDTLEKLRVIKEYSDILALPLGWGDELFAQATADAQSVGFEVHAWTTDEEAAPYEFMEGLGVTFVFTNNAAYGNGAMDELVLDDLSPPREGSARDGGPAVALIVLLPFFGVLVGVFGANAVHERGGWRRVIRGKGERYTDIDDEMNISVETKVSM